MPLTRWQISTRATEATPVRDAISNTLYFNVSGSIEEPNYTSLGDDLFTIWANAPWAAGSFIDVRGYDMSDPTPRPQKYIKRQAVGGTYPSGVHQVAICLSYYSDRNLPSQRGRIYLGPWVTTGTNASAVQTAAVIGLAPSLAGLGGLNVDWSLYSPKKGTATRINHAWCDDSWDIIRSRKLPPVQLRRMWDGNG